VSTCPKCGAEVYLTSVQNPRNGKWTVLPLDVTPVPDGQGWFTLTDVQQEAVDIMGTVAGTFPVVEYTPSTGTLRTHNPSHYLEA
jgi:hypothetical protein